ncbi:putative PAP-specific phosphatase, mitochondrial [Macadamia integrifolia]|uniref:putative PAP-specific phosphatase, mitochondrial n=1 Tax=Macadamia integrifolia TaxID=60698 RepID=UPI001C4E84C8|nr:putative PAP-specific phosphatase, mitochondrial [Macadamia integrifolia]
MFPSIPLVAEEDSSFLRSTPLSQAVVSAVIDKASLGDESLSESVVLEAIDRGGKDAFAFGTKPATYWLLDPIDGTKGFLKGGEALYVVGLALVVEGEIVLGVMGCPNWEGEFSKQLTAKGCADRTILSGSGIIMVAHIGCGTWTKRLSDMLGGGADVHNDWVRCFVDKCRLVHEARFCISDSQNWESLPLSSLFSSTNNAVSIGDRQILLLPTCCGSLCKYLMVASGKALVFILQARAQTIIKAWDHAVGVICVHEAGGQVTDWKGSQLDLAADHIKLSEGSSFLQVVCL